MISLDRVDRVLCDCCGDDMGQILGGVPTTAGAICDHTKAPYFAVCPDCKVNSSLELSGPYTREEFMDIVTSTEHWA